MSAMKTETQTEGSRERREAPRRERREASENEASSLYMEAARERKPGGSGDRELQLLQAGMGTRSTEQRVIAALRGGRPRTAALPPWSVGCRLVFPQKRSSGEHRVPSGKSSIKSGCWQGNMSGPGQGPGESQQTRS